MHLGESTCSETLVKGIAKRGDQFAALILVCAASMQNAHSQGGLPLWTNRLGSPNSLSHPYGIAVDNNSGNVFVTGYWGNAPYSLATVAYSGAGIALWTNTYSYGAGSAAAAEAMVIAIDTNNSHVYVTGFQDSFSPI